LIEEIHGIGAYAAIVVAGVGGLSGLGLAARKRAPGRSFTIITWAATALMLVQGALGLILYSGDGEPGSIHLFYGMLVAVALAFSYIYRIQFDRRPALAWGLLLLFLMGAGLRALANVGESF
jgi:hypothetical protein